MHDGSAASDLSATADALVPDDLRLSAALCRDTLSPLLDADWERPADGLAWPCRRTVQHIANALDWYGLLLVDPLPERVMSLGLRYVEQSVQEILAVIQKRARVLALLVASADLSVRGFHYWGEPDPSGYLAMGCAEILLHTDDVARSFGQDFSGPDALGRGIVERLFPWAPPAPGWTAGRCSAGRRAGSVCRSTGGWRRTGPGTPRRSRSGTARLRPARAGPSRPGRRHSRRKANWGRSGRARGARRTRSASPRAADRPSRTRRAS